MEPIDAFILKSFTNYTRTIFGWFDLKYDSLNKYYCCRFVSFIQMCFYVFVFSSTKSHSQNQTQHTRLLNLNMAHSFESDSRRIVDPSLFLIGHRASHERLSIVSVWIKPLSGHPIILNARKSTRVRVCEENHTAKLSLRQKTHIVLNYFETAPSYRTVSSTDGSSSCQQMNKMTVEFIPDALVFCLFYLIDSSKNIETSEWTSLILSARMTSSL